MKKSTSITVLINSLHWRTLMSLNFLPLTVRVILRHKETTLSKMNPFCQILRRTCLGLSMLCFACQTGKCSPPSSLPHRCQTLLGLLGTEDQNLFRLLPNFLQTNSMVPSILGHVCLGRDKKDTFWSSRKPTPGIH